MDLKRLSERGLRDLQNDERSYNNSLVTKVRSLYREHNMQEFIEEPSDREYVFLIEKAINELNTTSPMTPNRSYQEWLKDIDGQGLLTRMTLCMVVEMILADYTHKGIVSHSIEDIQVEDRTARYESLLQRCEKEKILEDTKKYKTARGIGVSEEEGLAKGVVRGVRVSDYDLVTRTKNSVDYFSNGVGKIGCGIKLIRWR